jgi:hypothetical protein
MRFLITIYRSNGTTSTLPVIGTKWYCEEVIREIRAIEPDATIKYRRIP